MPDYSRVPCPYRFDPPLTREERLALANALMERTPAFDDRFVQSDNYTAVYKKTGKCGCPKCRSRRGDSE